MRNSTEQSNEPEDLSMTNLVIALNTFGCEDASDKETLEMITALFGKNIIEQLIINPTDDQYEDLN